PDLHLAPDAQDLAVHRRADDSADVGVLSDEVARDDDIEAGLVSAFRNALLSSVDLTPSHGSACSAMSARASAASRSRCSRKTVTSCASSRRRSASRTNCCSACRTKCERLFQGPAGAVRRSSIEPSVSSSIVTAIVFISGWYPPTLIPSSRTLLRADGGHLRTQRVGERISRSLPAPLHVPFVESGTRPAGGG